MDKFLGTYNLSKLKQEEIENLNRPITSKEIESGIKNSRQTKVQDQTASQVTSTKHLKMSQYLFSNFSKKKKIYKRKKNFHIHSTKAALPWFQKHIKTQQKRELHVSISDEHICKNPQQDINKLNPQYIKKVILCDQVGFIPSM